MFRSASDEAAGILLVIQTAGSGDADYEAALSALRRMDEHTTRMGLPLVNVVLVDKGVSPPSATWRRRFAEANRAVRNGRYYYFLVVESLLIRGTFTAVTWLTGSREGHHSFAVECVADAIQQLADSGLSSPQLEQLERIARGLSSQP